MNLVSVVHIVLENLVIQTTTVADPVRHVTLTYVQAILAELELLAKYQ